MININNNITKNKKLYKKIINSILVLIFGISLGIFSKWLDDMAINDAVWWQNMIGNLNLRNIFSELGVWIFLAIYISIFSKNPKRAGINVLLFFAGMTISYHLYTIFICGFNPRQYMMIWYTITLLSPLAAYVCWYAKSNKKISYLISTLIITVMFLLSFSIGIWYFDFKSIIDTSLFIGTLIILYVNPKKSIYTFIGAIILSYLVRMII